MSKCRWNQESGDYLIDGDPCKTDDYGDPTRHCTARRTCSVHIGPDELTCPRCISRARGNLRKLTPLAALTLPVALTSGVNSEAANLAGPAAEPRAWRERRIAQKWHLDAWEELGRISEQQHLHAIVTLEDDDEAHPYSVTGRWAMMIAEDYGHDLPTLTVASAVDYLDRQLARIANDPEQDFRLFAAEVRKCRQHLEAAVSLAVRKERGAPCPECVASEEGAPRLVREFGHWCEADDCERIHHADDSADVWVCPRNREHEWSHEDYSRWVEERKGA